MILPVISNYRYPNISKTHLFASSTASASTASDPSLRSWLGCDDVTRDPRPLVEALPPRAPLLALLALVLVADVCRCQAFLGRARGLGDVTLPRAYASSAMLDPWLLCVRQSSVNKERATWNQWPKQWDTTRHCSCYWILGRNFYCICLIV